MAGGVERPAGQQQLRRQEPLARVDLCAVGEGPVGAVPLQLPAARPPAQALPHGAQLRLALRLHQATAPHATGRPQVSQRQACTHNHAHHVNIAVWSETYAAVINGCADR